MLCDMFMSNFPRHTRETIVAMFLHVNAHSLYLLLRLLLHTFLNILLKVLPDKFLGLILVVFHDL